MTGRAVDLGDVYTREEFGAVLRERLGRQSVRVLQGALDQQHTADRRALAAGVLDHPEGETAGKSTIADVFKGSRLPTQELLRSLLRLVGARDEEYRRWLAALRRIEASPKSRLQLSVGEADPRLLGVHRAIHMDGADGFLPDYVPRDIDIAERGVRALISAATEHGGFVLLVGGPSVGKTRCAYQAIAALLPDWHLLHPVAGSDQLARLTADPVPHTVVWLDELQRYLGGREGLTADTVRALLSASGPIVLVATLWPGRYSTYTKLPKDDGSEDPYRWEREVLALAEIVRLEPDWSEAELERACQAAACDPRIRYAVSAGGGFSLPQILAAAPQLADRWDNADSYAAGVLAAAVDATRLGYRSPLPADLLRAAAVGYCDSRAQAIAPVNWFETALAYATEPLNGAAATLEPVAAGMGEILGYTVADYLLQYAAPKRHRQPIPHHTWDALLTHTHVSADAARIGQAATNRILYCYALPLLWRSADAGDFQAAESLTELLVAQGDVEALREHADAGNFQAAIRLAGLLAERGDVDALRERANADKPEGAYWLARLLAKRGATDAAMALVREYADAGHAWAVHALVGLLVARDDIDALLECTDDPGVTFRLIGLLIERSDSTAAVALLRKYADAGHAWAVDRLATLLVEQGEAVAAITLLRKHADAGDSNAAFRHATLLAERGEIGALRDRADAGDTTAAAWHARLLVQRGDVDTLRDRADAGDTTAAVRLARLLVERGATGTAVTLLLKHADAGDISAAAWLAQLLADYGDVKTLRDRADAGDTSAALRLAELLAKRGDIDTLRDRADAGDATAAVRLAELLAKRGDIDILRDRADTGDLVATRLLDELLVDRGDVEGLRERTEIGDSNAALKLADLLVKRDDTNAAITLLRERADVGDSAAAARLIQLLADQKDVDALLTEIRVGNSEHAATAWFQLLEQSEGLADRHRARHVRRFGLSSPL